MKMYPILNKLLTKTVWYWVISLISNSFLIIFRAFTSNYSTHVHFQWRSFHNICSSHLHTVHSMQTKEADSLLWCLEHTQQYTLFISPHASLIHLLIILLINIGLIVVGMIISYTVFINSHKSKSNPGNALIVFINKQNLCVVYQFLLLFSFTYCFHDWSAAIVLFLVILDSVWCSWRSTVGRCSLHFGALLQQGQAVVLRPSLYGISEINQLFFSCWCFVAFCCLIFYVKNK